MHSSSRQCAAWLCRLTELNCVFCVCVCARAHLGYDSLQGNSVINLQEAIYVTTYQTFEYSTIITSSLDLLTLSLICGLNRYSWWTIKAKQISSTLNEIESNVIGHMQCAFFNCTILIMAKKKWNGWIFNQIVKAI